VFAHLLYAANSASLAQSITDIDDLTGYKPVATSGILISCQVPVVVNLKAGGTGSFVAGVGVIACGAGMILKY